DHVRPWLSIRMPTFEFSEEDINTLTRYFAAQDKVPFPYEPAPPSDPVMLATGHDLFDRWQCVRCHVVAGKLPSQDPATIPPGPEGGGACPAGGGGARPPPGPPPPWPPTPPRPPGGFARPGSPSGWRPRDGPSPGRACRPPPPPMRPRTRTPRSWAGIRPSR